MDENRLSKRIDQLLKKTGFDENFMRAIQFHLKVLYEYEMKNRKLESEQELCNVLMSKLFIDKMEMLPGTKFESTLNENSCWPVPVLPSEIFTGTFSEAYRKNCFYCCLNISDILDCRVASINPSEYTLKVIHKYGATRMLADLNLVVLMPRTEALLQLLGEELLPRELIRVAVTKIDDDVDEDDDSEDKEEEDVVEKKIVYVTLDENNVELERNQPTLGRISENCLPPYVLNPPNPEKLVSYSKYLKDKIPFHLSDFSVLEDFGIDCEMIHSFYPDLDGQKCDEDETVEPLMEKARLDFVLELIQFAITDRNKKHYSTALSLINTAIKICPDDNVLLSSLYNIRGTIYRNMEDTKCILNAMLDFKKALKLNPNQEGAKKNISEAVFMTAMKFYKTKEYKKAVLNAQYALQLNKENSEAASLLAYLKEKHPRAFRSPEEESLGILETQKAALLSKLKNLVDV